jgi:hypothetical protein
MHDEPSGDADDALLEELRSAASTRDPVPSALASAARDAFAWRTVDEELAALTFDSLDDDRPALVRGPAVLQERLLAFSAGHVSVDVQVTPLDGDRVRLIGQIDPPGPGSVQVRSTTGQVVADVDDLGRIDPVGLSGGPVSLRVERAGSTPVATEWIVV